MNVNLAVNAVDRIFEQAEQHPQRVALIHGEHAWTYSDLAARVTDLADAIEASGVLAASTSSPRVGLACPDGLAYVVLALGLLRAEACVVPVPSELSAAERLRIVELLGLTGLIIGPQFHWPNPPGHAASLDLSAFLGEAGENAADQRAIVLTALRGENAPPLGFDEDKLAAHQPAFIRFSSGTTGKSKGVVISHRTLVDRTAAANTALRIGPGDRVIWILPMAHHFAVSMMLYLTHGAATVVVGSHLAAEVLDAARAHEGTVLYGSPFHHTLLAQDTSGRDWPSLRLAVSTAAALLPATAEAFEKRFGLPLTQALGIIEIGLPVINLAAAHKKPTAIGRPLAGFDVELRDEQGQPLGPGEVGELFLRGPGMFDAYLLPWRPREQVLHEGWFSTGDLAKRDADGDLFLVGRTHSVINVAGLKCFPEEVEAVLAEHPQVRAVRVYGRPHPQVGSVPAAEIVPADAQSPPSPAALTAFCREKLAAYKRPLQFKFVESLSRTPSGKIRR